MTHLRAIEGGKPADQNPVRSSEPQITAGHYALMAKRIDDATPATGPELVGVVSYERPATEIHDVLGTPVTGESVRVLPVAPIDESSLAVRAAADRMQHPQTSMLPAGHIALQR